MCDEERRSYLDKVFGWYFDRSRAYVFYALAGSISGFGIFVSNGEFALGVAVGTVFAASAAVVNHFLSRLHREYLCCLVLLRDLARFRDRVQVVIAEDGEPEARAYGYCPKKTVKALKWWARQEARVACSGSDESSAVGRYLLFALGPVPTDHYERSLKVRRCVEEVLEKADTVIEETRETTP